MVQQLPFIPSSTCSCSPAAKSCRWRSTWTWRASTPSRCRCIRKPEPGSDETASSSEFQRRQIWKWQRFSGFYNGTAHFKKCKHLLWLRDILWSKF